MLVLHVDDHPLMCDYMSAVLRKALKNVSVHTESHFAGALEYARRADKIDLAVLDLSLPDCTGLDVVKRFRAAFPAIPVLVFSGTDEAESMRAALAAGAAGYVPKTAAIATIVDAVRQVAGGGSYVP